MQRRRVGTISVAIVLIGFGVLMFISQISKISAVELGIKFWPAILFLIGGEILWHSYKYKDEDIKIKYDILSIFVVILIVGVNLVIYGVVETGVMDKFSAMVSSQNFSYQIPFNEVEVNDDIKKIVINPLNYSSLSIRTGKEDKIISTGSLDITMDSEENAKEFLNDEYIKVDKVGAIAYVSFIGRANYNDGTYSINPYGFSLIIPEDKEVEISNVNDLELTLDYIKNDWIIDDANHTKIRLKKDLDVKINALVDSQEMLGGNVKWDFLEDNSEESSNPEGQLIYGEGENTINILNSYEVIVNEL